MGLEAIRHFLQAPKMAVKSLKYEYPAEFIVPTNLESDIGPLGNTFETEFLKEELPIGLRKDDMRKGILVAGTEPLERFLANTKIIFESEKRSVSYIIITSNKNYRRLIDFIPSMKIFRLGEDITLNPLDTEGVTSQDYIPFFMNLLKICVNFKTDIYAAIEKKLKDIYVTYENKPTIESFKEQLWNGVVEPESSKIEQNEFNTVFKYIENLLSGESARIIVNTKYPIFEIIADVPALIEIDLNDRRTKRFFILLILIKILTLSKFLKYRDFMILIDDGDLIFGNEKEYHGQDSDPHFSLLEWIKVLRENDIGLHISVQYPSLILPQLLSNFQNVFVHKTHSFEESQALRSVLNMSFRPQEEGAAAYSEKRKYQYQYELLRVLEEAHALVNRPDAKSCFPMVFDYLDFDRTHVPEDQEIKNRLKIFYPGWDASPIQVPEKSSIERNFSQYAEKIKEILLILTEYEQMMYSAIQSATMIEDAILLVLLNKLVQLRYLIQSQELVGVTRRNTYKITQSGIQKLLEYCHMKGEITDEDYRKELDTRGFKDI